MSNKIREYLQKSKLAQELYREMYPIVNDGWDGPSTSYPACNDPYRTEGKDYSCGCWLCGLTEWFNRAAKQE